MILARPARASRITIAHRDPARIEADAVVREPVVPDDCAIAVAGLLRAGDESLRQKQPTC